MVCLYVPVYFCAIMRQLIIFLYFLGYLTLAIHMGDGVGALVLLLLFLPFFSYAEQYDHT
jgi:hypothetical protein